MNAPRHDAAAERAILGAAMLDHRIIDDCPIAPADFYRPEHEALWAVITREHRAGRPTDAVTLTHRIGDIPGLTAADLSAMVMETPTVASAPHYAKIVAGLATLRRLHDTGTRLQQLAQVAAWDEAAAIVETSRAEVDAVPTADTDAGVRTFHEALLDAIDVWDKPDTSHVHRTGWADLDDVLNGGWRPGHLTIMGARPAVGKSLIAGCAAVQCARYGVGVGFFGLEMSETEVVGRMAAHAAGIDVDRIEKRALTELDWQRLARLATDSTDWPLFLDNRSALSMAQIRAKVRTWTRRGPLPLVVIDYLQLIRAADSRDNRERQVSRIAEDCKHLAREFDTHVLALAQVGRGPTQRTDKRPTMSDLRESGGQEAHADEVILLHRDDEEAPGEIELNVEKNRHGPTRRVVLAWAPHRASALNMHREH